MRLPMSLTFWLQYAMCGLLIALSPHVFLLLHNGFRRRGELHGDALHTFLKLTFLAPLGTVVLLSALVGALVRIFF